MKTVLGGFRGTIVVPTDESIVELISVMEVDPTNPEDLQNIKHVIEYHMAPGNVLFSEAVENRSLRVNTALAEEAAREICTEGDYVSGWLWSGVGVLLIGLRRILNR